ncbi:MAG: ATP-binding protein [Defluviitaleaceae bacterium]|nr:ATP-binding protein [Defluviitaleaceae bacterium]
MSVRIRTITAIVLTNMLIITFSVLAGIINVGNSINRSQEIDLELVAHIADHFISSEINVLKLKAVNIAQVLLLQYETGRESMFGDLSEQHPEFIGAAVFNTEKETFAKTGIYPAAADTLLNLHIKQAFDGRTMLSTTMRHETGKLVFYLSTPMGDTDGHILVLTIDGMYFSELVSAFEIWKTGHIFIDDADGYIIANMRESWVQNRVNLLEEAVIDPNKESIARAEVIGRAQRGETGTGRFTVEGMPRLCAFRPISGSDEDWFLGVIAPLHESPFRDVNRALIFAGFVGIILGTAAAIVAANFIKKPYEEAAALKEAAEINSKYKSEFIAGMSHEIRTPMNVILGVTEILVQDDKLDKNVAEGLNKIIVSGDMLLNIINDILDLSKIEAGKLELVNEKYDTASLINDTVSLNMIRFGSKPIVFKLFVDEKMPSTLIGDELRIKQILNNLLSNAFKYTDSGTVTLKFLTNVDHGKNMLVFTVSDTGQGMTEEQVASLFDEYTRFNLSANRTTEGTGLGMSITQNLLQLMGGSIAVKSEPGKGSVFTVKIPQEVSGEETLGANMAEALQNFQMSDAKLINKSQIVYESMPYGKILVVDDAESNLYITRGLLAPYRINVETVTSGYQAIDKINAGYLYDIIFMDHMMPNMDGMETTRIIRKLGYKRPIVALTANAVAGQMNVFLSNGFNDFISKPVDVRRLNTVLKKFVRDTQPPDVLNAVRKQQTEIPKTAADKPLASVTPQLAEFFYRDALKASAVLRDMADKHGNYTDKDVLLFTTVIHAMKNALLHVGENALSAAAKELEQAGNKNDAGFLSAGIPAFLNSLQTVMDKYAPEKEDGLNLSKTGENYIFLKEKLALIIEACNTYDKKTAKDTIVELRQFTWPHAVKGPLGLMAEQLLSGDYREVAEEAEKLRKMAERITANDGI